MCPFAERYNDKRPLNKYGQMEEIEPEIVLKNAGIDEKTRCKSRNSHHEKPDYKEPVRRMRELAFLAALADAADNEVGGDNENDRADRISEDIDNWIFGAEPVEKYRSKQQRQISKYKKQVFVIPEFIEPVFVAVERALLCEHVNKQLAQCLEIMFYLEFFRWFPD